jgi:hypothetical protein
MATSTSGNIATLFVYLFIHFFAPKMREALGPLSAACFRAQSDRTATFRHTETIPAYVQAR